jgi:ABC-2 type transport system ATP-binding protein/lipopolysaccharide transport system ATP-binding protein
MISSVADSVTASAVDVVSAPAVQIDDVSVRYRVPRDRMTSLKEYAIARLRGRAPHFEHDALKSVSLTVGRSEALAVIGPNGSGKTTLLRLIARVLTPSAGRVRTWGRVAPLLDVVGAFHPELTGRENIFLNGTLLGLSRRDISARFDRIVDFAEVGAFIDAPLRTYSSGMMARLGFAVASDTEADIIVIDEALGVGDERFQRKCAARIDAIRAQGTTFILVSHDMHSVQRLCSRAVWLERGVIRETGPVGDVVRAFLEAQ